MMCHNGMNEHVIGAPHDQVVEHRYAVITSQNNRIPLTFDYIEYGGDFMYLNPLTVINPKFNNLILFKVSPTSWHVVTPVAPHTPNNIRRLAFSGWWNGP